MGINSSSHKKYDENHSYHAFYFLFLRSKNLK